MPFMHPIHRTKALYWHNANDCVVWHMGRGDAVTDVPNVLEDMVCTCGSLDCLLSLGSHIVIVNDADPAFDVLELTYFMQSVANVVHLARTHIFLCIYTSCQSDTMGEGIPKSTLLKAIGRGHSEENSTKSKGRGHSE